MKPNFREFMLEAGIGTCEYKDLIGLRTRNKTVVLEPSQVKKIEEKKKMSKIEQYAPPEIKKILMP